MASLTNINAGLDPSGNMDVEFDTDLPMILTVQVDYDLNTPTPQAAFGVITGPSATSPGFTTCNTLCNGPDPATEFEAVVDGLDSNGQFVNLRSARQTLATGNNRVDRDDKLRLSVTPATGKVGDVLKLEVEYTDTSGAPDAGIRIRFNQAFGVVVGHFSSRTAITDAAGKCSVDFTIDRKRFNWVTQGPILFSARAGGGGRFFPRFFAPSDYAVAHLTP